MKFYLALTILIFFTLTNGIAQNYMLIKQKDGKVTQVRLSDITKISFNAITTNITQKESKEIQKIFNLKSYPNPATDFINIDYELISQDNLNLEVYSLSGILTHQISLSNQVLGKNTYQFDLRNLPIGTYIFKLRQNNKILFDKVIKNK